MSFVYPRMGSFRSKPVPRDFLGQYYTPETIDHFDKLGLIAPTSLRLCQEASGDLLDSIGSKTLTAATSPLYQQTVSGWTRKAIGFNGGSAQRFRDAAYGNPATTSLLVIMYASMNAITAGGFMTYGATDDASVSNAGAGKWRYRDAGTSGGLVDTTSTYHDSAIRPLVFQYDVTNSKARLFTNTEKLSPTFGPLTGTAFAYGSNTGVSLNSRIVWACEFLGASAEMSDAQIKTYLQTLGWAISWT